MGGYNSGGHNKTHRQLENFHRVDSFAFYDYLMGDKYLYCKTTMQYPLNRGDIIYHVQSRTALIKVLSVQDREYRYVDLPLSRVHGIDGKSVRMYFHCPYCGRRVRYLYDYYKHYACRTGSIRQTRKQRNNFFQKNAQALQKQERFFCQPERIKK